MLSTQSKFIVPEIVPVGVIVNLYRFPAVVLKSNFEPDVDQILETISSTTKIIFLYVNQSSYVSF